uniref:Uncharacterized protein n=1 Tax=Alexandrium monilatum TaxID=311494 RepID=A0A7S4Q0F7_9DINO|mmetsp:Transcript_16018/g.48279  ORF Transcript_16018/g.48279 Transcript_16018/m.48279 type:complete len:143 (+) Transcript_16018:68-496(+)
MATALRAAAATRNFQMGASAAQAQASEAMSGGAEAEDKSKKEKRKDGDEDGDEDKNKENGQDPAERILQSEWLNDLMLGFAKIYSVTIETGKDCGDCVNRTAYPIKERLLDAVDAVSDRVNPSAEHRTARGDFSATPTFSHE